MPATDYYKQIILEGGTVDLSNAFVGLATSAPITDSTVPSEVTASEYIRIVFTPSSYSSGITNVTEYVWIATSSWASVEYVFVSNSSQGGKALLYDQVTLFTPTAGTIIKIPIGNMSVS